MDIAGHIDKISTDGFAVIDEVYTRAEIADILSPIKAAGTDKETFRKSGDLFAIRQFFKELPQVKPFIFDAKLRSIIAALFGEGYFISKSIYFDKPGASNWFVAWHQDLTISVTEKIEVDGFGPWTVKQNQFAVQPPVDILNNNFTIRIHLDDADEDNGALKVIPHSHNKGIYRFDAAEVYENVTCNVKAGGIMIMRPLLMHASGRTTNNKPRKVIHIEFSRSELPDKLNWSEKDIIF